MTNVNHRFLIIFCALFAFAPKSLRAQANWKATIESVKPSIVMLEIELLTKLENEAPGCYQATGFIVDEKKGLILTNRHVITAGPVTARATFWNKEKVEVKPVYYDPIHDFGFYRYDPSLLRWIKPKALRLGDSDKVKPGEEIRVLGNNASEGLSIIEGTVSWVKKNAPTYSDPDTYRDFNTYYFQTSADVSGGSSGGPIIDRTGDVLAINSSSKSYTTVSWGLPINTVKRALKNIREGKETKRGDIGAKLVFSPFDETVDYGFPKRLITILKEKNPDIEGLIAVKETIPQSDAAKYLKPADVIWEIAGIKIGDNFAQYERLLDSNIGKKVPVTVVRDGKSSQFMIDVTDLEETKIKSFVRIGFDYFSRLPLFMAYSYNVPLEGVFVPSINYNFSEKTDFPDFLIITEFGGSKIFSPEDLMKVLKKTQTGENLRISYKVLKEDHRLEQKVFRVNWKWFKPDYFKISGATNDWLKAD